MVTAESFKWFTRRDMEMIKMIYFHRYVSTNQINRIFFSVDRMGNENKYSDTITRRRLKKMRDHKLIKSYLRADNKDAIHCIDHDGVFVVAGLLNKTFNDLYFSNKKDLLSIGLAEHSLLINEVYIQLLEATRGTPGIIDTFQVENINQEKFEYNGEKYNFIPDVFMIYKPNKYENRGRMYFLEVDNNTETPSQFKPKFSQYEAYYNSGIFQDKWNGLFPDVIVICPDEKRAEKLKKITPELKTNWRYTTFDNVNQIIEG